MLEKTNIKENKKLKIILIVLDLIILCVIPIFKNFYFQDILFLVFSFLTIFLISPSKIKSVVVISFIIRIVFVLIDIYLIPLPESRVGSDAAMFEGIAFQWSQMGLPWLLNNFTSGSFMYSWIIAIIYSFVGRNLFIIQGLNALFGAFVVLNVYLIGKETWGHREAYFAAVISTFFPTLIYFSALPFREIPIIWSFTLGVYFVLLWFKKTKLLDFIAGVLLFVLSLGFHTAMLYLLLALIILVVISLVGGARNHSFVSLSKFLSEVSILLLVFIFVYKTGWGLEKIGGIISSPPSSSGISSPSVSPPNSLAIPNNLFHKFLNTVTYYLSNVEKTAARDRAAYLINLQIKGVLDFFWQTPIRIIFFLFTPFIWQVRTSLDLFGFLDAISYIIMSMFIISNFKKIFKDRSALLISLFLLGCLIVFSLTTSNYGTALRHRAKFAPLMIVLSAPFLSQYIENIRRILLRKQDNVKSA